MKSLRTNPKTKGSKAGWKRKASALIMILLVFAPYIVFAGSSMAQTIPGYKSSSQDPIDQSGAGTNKDASDPAYETTPPAPYKHNLPSVPYGNGKTTAFPQGTGQNTNLVQQIAEQNMDWHVTWDLTNPFGTGNNVYDGLHQWYTDDIFDNLFAGIGQLFGKWLYEFITGWMCDVVRFLTGALATFVLNPNIPNNVAQGKDDISMAVHKMADIMFSIALDLLLLLFILCIWKYWAEANWRGMLNPMGSVMRLISTAGILLAWPTIYSFVTELANQMIKAIWFNTADSMAEFDQAIVTIIKAGLVDTAAGLVSALAPVMGNVGTSVGFGGWILGAVGGTVSFAAELIFGLLTAIIIGQLLVILMLKAVQTALLIAQYMFAPLFIVFFAVPDTEQFTVKYMYGFAVVSLWTFVWLALFRLLVIVLNSANNPWGKILLVLGVLQLMIQGPAFMMTGTIEPKLSFLDAKDIIEKITGAPAKAAGAFGKLWDSVKEGAKPPPNPTGPVPGAPTPAFVGPGQAPPGAGPAFAGPGVGGGGGHGGAATNVTGQTPGLPGPKMLGLPGPSANPPTGGGPTPPPPGPTGGTGGGGAAFQGTGTGTGTGSPTNPTPGGIPPTGQGPNIGGGPSGGGIGTPPVKPAQDLSFADKYGGETKFRAGLEGLQKDLADNKIRLNYTDGEASYGFGSKQDLNEINIPKASSPEDVARRVAVGSSVRLLGTSARAKNIAENGAHAMGYDRPIGDDLQAASIEGKHFKDSSRGKYRAERGAQRYAVEGAEAYYRGEDGNDYTKMLQEMNEGWTAERQADTDSMIINHATRPDSPFHASYGTTGTVLSNLAIKPTAATRAAAGHTHIRSMPKGMQRTAIKAVSAHILEEPSVVSLDGPDKNVMLGQLTSQLTEDQVDAITEMYVTTGGSERAVFNDHVNAGVQTLTRNTRLKAGQAYRVMNQMGGVSNDPVRVQSRVDVIQEAFHAGMTDSHLFRTQSVEVGKMADMFLANNDPEPVREIAVAAKIIGGSMPTRDEVITVSSMRANGWNVYNVKQHELRAAEQMLSQGIIPDRTAVFNHLNQNKGFSGGFKGP